MLPKSRNNANQLRMGIDNKSSEDNSAKVI